MKLFQNLKDKFLFVNKVNIEKEFGVKVLKIEVNSVEMNIVSEMSKKINEYLDEIVIPQNVYFVDIHSPGTETDLNIYKLEEHINKNIFVETKKTIQQKNKFEGFLLRDQLNFIVLNYNSKGQFRNIEIEKKNIIQIRLSAVVKKEK
ncbi:MAG: hypothetical protein K4H23_01100 [Mollicutes bacterium PWAP]|nr:hypothetical protein [Mollicutes bacterium PWAP]